VLRTLFVIAALAALTGCQEAQTKVLIGGTCSPGAGAAPIQDAIVVVSGSTIRAVGLRKDIPVPQDSERTNLEGKWILPGGAEPIAPGQPANLVIYNSPQEATTPIRRMTAGKWNP
jgi:hypothetical protein